MIRQKQETDNIRPDDRYGNGGTPQNGRTDSGKFQHAPVSTVLPAELMLKQIFDENGG